MAPLLAWRKTSRGGHIQQGGSQSYCFSYSPLLTRFKTVNPAFLASGTESGFSFIGELKLEMIFRTGFLQAGQAFSSAAVTGRRRVNRPPHAAQVPSQSSYSYRGMRVLCGFRDYLSTCSWTGMRNAWTRLKAGSVSASAVKIAFSRVRSLGCPPAMANQTAFSSCGARVCSLAAAAALLFVHTIPAHAATFQNPVLPGDYPDPSVIRVGEEYWASATSSEWAPFFPLLKSRDLVNWEWVGNAFERRPEWATGRFWAPEIWEHKGKFFLYYVGLKKGGPLAVAVATADHPAGPWTDHGPMVAQEAGSIDAMPVADLDGTLYLIWKEDGNSRNKPTPLWIQKMSPDGTKLVGEMKEILRNDADWERNLIEGPYVQRQGDFWYMFYSGNGCCGNGCNYALGVARARNLMGPWEKCPSNPLLIGTDMWKCPGHGSVVRDKDGRDWLLYHAYQADPFIYVGRQGLLDPVTWKDGWPVINEGKGPSTTVAAPAALRAQQPLVDFRDEFTGGKLQPQWQWPQDMDPKVSVAAGKLRLSAVPRRPDAMASAVVAVRTTTGNYVAETSVDVLSLDKTRSGGLSAYGDHDNALGASVKDGKLLVWKRQRGKEQILSTNTVPGGETVFLRMKAAGGHRFTFSASGDGRSWTALGDNVAVEGKYLPPWDRGIRVALVAGGNTPEAVFGPLRVTQTGTGQ